MNDSIARALHDAAIKSNFSGVIRVDGPTLQPFARAYGLANRALQIPMRVDHRLMVASVAKGFTALTIGALIDDGVLSFTSEVRRFLGDDLSSIDDTVTVEQLLSHTSGIGDYIDEDTGSVLDYVLAHPVHEFSDTESFLQALGAPQVTEPGLEFRYNNSGFVLLALVAERASGMPFHELVNQRVFVPAGMISSNYPRTDEISGDTALSYLEQEGLRTNILHLPVRGSGDGGAVTTLSDLAEFWSSLFKFRIVSAQTLAALTEPLHKVYNERMYYGRGFWRGWDSNIVILEGYDAGISARTWYDQDSEITGTVISNTSEGAWPVLRAVKW